MNLTPQQARLLLILLGDEEFGSAIRPDRFTGEQALSIKAELKDCARAGREDDA